MEEARQVLDRLGRIEQLRREDADPRHLLGEVRALLEEAERWISCEGPGGGRDLRRAVAAVDNCREELAGCERVDRQAPVAALNGIASGRRGVVRQAG